MSVLGSAVLLGSSVAMASAAWPAPFVSSGAAAGAIVVGVNAATSDVVAANELQTSLQASVTGGSSSGSGEGDTVLLEKSSDKFNLGDSASSVFVTSLDEDDMPNLLAEGTYTDDDNTEYEYTQKIALGTTLNLSHFSDTDYKDKTPTVGIRLADNSHVLNYTLDFSTNPLFNDSQLETTDMVIMGKTYYVLDVINSSTAGADKLTLLDSASGGIVTEGETATINGKDCAISFISSSEVKLTVDGQTTNSLAEGGTYKLTDGNYVGIKDIMYSSKDTGISKVEISIGSGKLEVLDGSEIELNDDTIEEIVGFISLDSSAKLDKLILQWKTDDEAYVAPDAELVMPGFEAVKLSMAEFIVPSEELTTVEYSGSDVIELKTVLKDGSITIPLLKTNSTGEIELLGKDSTNRLVTNQSTELFFNQTAGDKYIVASWNSSTEAESYYLKVDLIQESNVNKVRFFNEVTGAEKKAGNNSDVSFGNVVVTVGNIDRDGSNKWVNLSINSGGSWNTLYTDAGLKVYLPFLHNSTGTTEGLIQYRTNASTVDTYKHYPLVTGNYANITLGSTAGHGYDSFYLYMIGEDKDGNLAKGTKFNMTIDDSSDKIQVSTVNTGSSSGTYGYEIEDTDNYESYVIDALATKALYHTGGDQDYVEITYHDDQAYAEVYAAAPEANIIDNGGEIVVVKDNEVDSVSSKNLIVVGGSCINSVAATMLGLSASTCGDDFSAATNVGAGQYLIKVMSSPYAAADSEKIAMLVAGYNAADTTAGVDKVMEGTVSTTVGTSDIYPMETA